MKTNVISWSSEQWMPYMQDVLFSSAEEGTAAWDRMWNENTGVRSSLEESMVRWTFTVDPTPKPHHHPLWWKNNPHCWLCLFIVYNHSIISSPIKTKGLSSQTNRHTHTPHQGLFDSSFTMHHGAVLARASLRDGPQRSLWLCWRQWHNSNT